MPLRLFFNCLKCSALLVFPSASVKVTYHRCASNSEFMNYKGNLDMPLGICQESSWNFQAGGLHFNEIVSILLVTFFVALFVTLYLLLLLSMLLSLTTMLSDSSLLEFSAAAWNIHRVAAKKEVLELSSFKAQADLLWSSVTRWLVESGMAVQSMLAKNIPFLQVHSKACCLRQ